MSGKREAKLLSKKSPEENNQEEDDDDDDDIDYVPEKEADDDEDEKSGDDEDHDEDDEVNGDDLNGSVNKKRKLDEQETEKSEQVKQKEADIWSSFLKDVGGIKKTSQAETQASSSDKSSSTGSQPKESATKNFFPETSSKIETKAEATTTKTTQEPEKKKVKTGGLAGLLNKLDKKTTESTLSKSKLDWEEFKKVEDIQEDLTIHSKGKTSYLDRQAFLERVDYRQFELERSHRDRNRIKKD